ncbi:hypothetical protein RRG08_050147 [Elysia crispata]|uniref:Uncharacterized protein n=1 Tax=Elysia crispata TaxID=231223 RepID=A0AAE1DWH5_9GAST|nr:hypothetical protein RRG08_050147 [Elysia crispata]
MIRDCAAGSGGNNREVPDSTRPGRRFRSRRIPKPLWEVGVGEIQAGFKKDDVHGHLEFYRLKFSKAIHRMCPCGWGVDSSEDVTRETQIRQQAVYAPQAPYDEQLLFCLTPILQAFLWSDAGSSAGDIPGTPEVSHCRVLDG